MEVIPAIDIRDGRCVQLKQGDFARQTAYGDHPVAMAKYWQHEEATRLHVVDLDGAKAGRPEQQEAILQVIAELGGDLAVQVGGGIRQLRDVKTYIEAGAARVILGSAAIKDQETVVKACDQYPGQIVVALDARNGKVAAEAWHETSEVDALDLAEELEAAGAARFLYTDIARDGMLGGPNVAGLRALAQRLSAPVIASGGVSSLDDIEAVRDAGAEAVIVGTALYERRFTLADAIEKGNK